MRIIGGRLGGRTLKAPPGMATRPTSDKVREALFNILFSRGVDFETARVLDLFAGSGALGFEALSRGGQHVDFVDSDQNVARLITDNARALSVDKFAHVHCQWVEKWLPRAEPAQPYDLVFIDPPYADHHARSVALDGVAKLLAPTAIVVVEQASKDDRPKLKTAAITVADERKYGQTTILIYQPATVEVDHG